MQKKNLLTHPPPSLCDIAETEDTQPEEPQPLELPPFTGAAVPIPVPDGSGGEWQEKYEAEAQARRNLEKSSSEQAALIKKLQTQLVEETRLKRLAEESSAGLKEVYNVHLPPPFSSRSKRVNFLTSLCCAVAQ